uniref:Retrotransposon gag domain-containing protein n=1 Tax=Nicotiana tabacum TaxID=4097 RepID=A0A1S3YX26_TOBAC|nr:PREDICTED: uncharacterized protein LOC107780384 [Nicotiana tabacum]
MSANFTGTPSDDLPQAPFSGVSSTIFTLPVSTTAQPIVPMPCFVPSAFTFQVPQFQLDTAHVTPNSYPQHPRYESPIEQERTVKNPEQEEITRKMKSIEQSLKNMQGLSGQKCVSYVDLCMFPRVHLLVGFKMPKFERYDEHGDPITHLKRYCDQLRGAGRKKELLMAYFEESLTGIALESYMEQDISHWHMWDDMARDFVRQFQYNVDIAPNNFFLSNLKKKSSESFREYAIKWREQVARSGLGGLANRKKKEEGAMVASRLRNSRQSRGYFGSSPKPPQHYCPHQDAPYAMAPRPYEVMNAHPYTRPQQYYNLNRAPPPRKNPPRQASYNSCPPHNNYQYNTCPREPPRKANFTPIGESYSSLFPKLVQMGLLQPVPPNRQNIKSPSYRLGTRCAYHSGEEGHDTEDCWTIKRAVENMIERKRVVLRDKKAPNATNNPLSTHNKGPIIGMICEDKEFDRSLKAIIAICRLGKQTQTGGKTS